MKFARIVIATTLAGGVAHAAYASEYFSRTIGEGILRRFKAIYDYPKSTIYLEPNADFGKPFQSRKTFGATYLSEGSDFTVFKVTGIRKDSAAEAAGLKSGDVITAVDGKPASAMRLAELRKVLTTEDSRHVLDVRRGEETLRLDALVKLVSSTTETTSPDLPRLGQSLGSGIGA